MPFYVAKNETELDAVMSADVLMKSAPDYYAPRFEAIKELRSQDDGTLHKGSEFRRVASFVNVPLFMAAKLADPELLKDKKKFYAFVDRNREYVAYDRRSKHSRAEMDRNKLPLGLLGLDVPGTLQVTEHVIEPTPDSAEGTVGE